VLYNISVACVRVVEFGTNRVVTQTRGSVDERSLLCRVDALYSFFIQWSPNVSGDGEFDVNDRGFVVLGSADSGAPTTDGAEERPTNHPGRKWHVSSVLVLFGRFLQMHG